MRHQVVVERLHGEQVFVANQAVGVARECGAQAARVHQRNLAPRRRWWLPAAHRPPAGRSAFRRPGSRRATGARTIAPDDALGQRRGQLFVLLDQLRLHRVLGEAVGAHDQVVRARLAHVAAGRVEHEIDLGHQRAVLVGAGHQAAVDAADVGTVGVAADDKIDRRDRAARRCARSDPRCPGTRCSRRSGRPPSWISTTMASMPWRLQLGHQRVDRWRLVAKLQTGHAGGHDDAAACPSTSGR